MTQVEAFWAGQCRSPWWPLWGLVHGKVVRRMPLHAKGQQACQRSWRGDLVHMNACGYHWHLGLLQCSWAIRVCVVAAIWPV